MLSKEPRKPINWQRVKNCFAVFFLIMPIISAFSLWWYWAFFDISGNVGYVWWWTSFAGFIGAIINAIANTDW